MKDVLLMIANSWDSIMLLTVNRKLLQMKVTIEIRENSRQVGWGNFKAEIDAWINRGDSEIRKWSGYHHSKGGGSKVSTEVVDKVS